MSVCRKPGFEKNTKEHNTADIPITRWNFCPKLLSISVARNHFWAAQINRYAEPLGCHLAALRLLLLRSCPTGGGPALTLPMGWGCLAHRITHLWATADHFSLLSDFPAAHPLQPQARRQRENKRGHCALLPAGVGLPGAASPPELCPAVV